MIVTEIKEAHKQYLISPAPLKHPAKIICDTWNKTIIMINLEINTPMSKISALLKNKEKISLPKKNIITARTIEMIKPIF